MKSNVRNIMLIFVVGWLALMSSSCATIISGSVYPVKFESEQPNTDIAIVDDRGVELFRGETPVVVKLRSNAGFFDPAEYQVIRYEDDKVVNVMNMRGVLDPWYLANPIILIPAIPIALFGSLSRIWDNVFWELFFIVGASGFLIDAGVGSMWELPSTFFVD